MATCIVVQQTPGNGAVCVRRLDPAGTFERHGRSSSSSRPVLHRPEPGDNHRSFSLENRGTVQQMLYTEMKPVLSRHVLKRIDGRVRQKKGVSLFSLNGGRRPGGHVSVSLGSTIHSSASMWRKRGAKFGLHGLYISVRDDHVCVCPTLMLHSAAAIMLIQRQDSYVFMLQDLYCLQ